MKDNFSSGSDQYLKFRPTYPSDFIDYLNALVRNKGNAWDCGTGTGQLAVELSRSFQHVFATDISRSQLDNALQADNISYSVQPAEHTHFRNKQFDLITVGQAIHWFDFEKFYAEVRRTAKDNAIFCAVGYRRIKVSEQVDSIITHFYENVLGGYWDAERQYVDENYATIPFPFSEIETPRFEIKLNWTFEHFINYFNTWSAVKHFIKRNGHNPVDALANEVKGHWGDMPMREVSFPLLLRIGRLP